MASAVTGELRNTISRQIREIRNQLDQSSGYPFNPRDLSRHLQAAIEGKFPNQIGKFEVWQTLKRDPDACQKRYLVALAIRGVQLNPPAQVLLATMGNGFVNSVDEIRLVRVTGYDLGWWRTDTSYPTVRKLCDRAAEFGLKRVPQWVPFQLAWDYEQPYGEAIYFSTMPVEESSLWYGLVHLNASRAGHYTGRSLEAAVFSQNPDDRQQISPGHTMVFSVPAE